VRMTLFAAAMLSAVVGADAQASQTTTQWYFGRWSCSIDGRPATMVWEVRDDPQTSCNGNTCSTSSGVKVVGFFKERTGPWVRLYRVRSSDVGLAMLYNNVDAWVLNRRGARAAAGHTTWQGGRYPLSCNKA
jgi:hypothetical protein